MMITILACLGISGIAFAADERWTVDREFGEWALSCRPQADGKECLVAITIVVHEQPADWLQVVWRVHEGSPRLTLEMPHPLQELHTASAPAFGGIAMRFGPKWGPVNLTEEMCRDRRCSLPLGYSPSELTRLAGKTGISFIVPSSVVKNEGTHFVVPTEGLEAACAALVANLK
jgi:invasion protein IalB